MTLPKYGCCNLLIFALDKNSKDVFLKKLQICMKTYDYKDETKDVRGKVRISEHAMNIPLRNDDCFCVPYLTLINADIF